MPLTSSLGTPMPSGTSTSIRARSRRRVGAAILIALAAALTLASCSSSNSAATTAGNGGGSSSPATITLLAHSPPAKAFDALIAAFNKTPAGKNITIETSFRASGTQANDVVEGQPADVVNFSLEP